MNMFKKCKVVMLPTYEKAPLMIEKNQFSDEYNKLLFAKNYGFDEFNHIKNFEHTNKQHLYILSDDEIKEGDWFIGETNIIKQVSHISKTNSQIHTADKYSYFRHKCKKIIAATDKSLCDGKCAKNECVCVFPQPSEGFIDVYIDFYNRGQPITEVMVEYNECSRHEDCIGDFNSSCSKPTTKVNAKDNTITIIKTKDSWTREEVISLLYSFGNKMENANYEKPYYRYDEWIEENL